MYYAQRIAMAIITLTVPGASVATSLHAQNRVDSTATKWTTNSGAIDGTVVDTAYKGLIGVEVLLLDSKQTGKTNGGGAYRIEGVEPGDHVMRFRRLGLQPMTLTVSVIANDVTGVDVIMGSMHQLATIQVVAKSGEIMSLPKEFVKRMQTGMGHYMTQEDIENRHALSTAELFSNIPGVAVKHGSTQGSMVVASTRGINSIFADPCTGGIPMYVNGVDAVGGGTTPQGRVEKSGLPQTVSRTPLQSLDIIAPSDIAGIEVYTGPAGLPATVPPSACGAIIIWTK